jgi:hypothetical protein
VGVVLGSVAHQASLSRCRRPCEPGRARQEPIGGGGTAATAATHPDVRAARPPTPTSARPGHPHRLTSDQ